MKQIDSSQLKKLYCKCRKDLKEIARILSKAGEITVINNLQTVSTGGGNLISVYPAVINNNNTYISKNLIDYMLNKQLAIVCY